MTDDTGADLATVTSDGVELEVVLDPAPAARAVAVVTHPHPRMGGDLHNPVPAGVARGLAAAGVSALRCNFRGTGRSGGTHSGGDLERLDVAAAVETAARLAPDAPVFGVGYSFGADVVLATADDRFRGVVAVAPPLRVLGVHELRAPRGGAPTLVLSPAHDQFCDADSARDVVSDWPLTTVEAVPGADHFLTGAVSWVVERVVTFVDEVPAA